jgi:hypothetical protein
MSGRVPPDTFEPAEIQSDGRVAMLAVNHALKVRTPNSEIHQVEQLNNRMLKALNSGS